MACKRLHPFLKLVALAAIMSGTLVAQPQQPARGSCEAMLRQWRDISTIAIPEWRAVPMSEATPGATALPFDDSAWPVVKPSHRFDVPAVWLRATVEIPAARGGYSWKGARLELETSVYVHWQTRDMNVYRTVFVNGVQRAAGYEFEPVVLSEAAVPGEKLIIAMRAQTSAGKLILGDARIHLTGVRDRPPAQSVLEACTAAELLNALPDAGAAGREAILQAARSRIDFAALQAANDQARFDLGLVAAELELQKLRPWLKTFTVFAAGNSHIDMAWLWPWSETVEVVRNTFASALTLMQEFPEFKFTHGSVATYAWMEDKYPALFAEIQRRAREGRWEMVGGMWVEPDLNMPDGESLTRQLLVGTRYLKQKFGVDIRVGYSPDTFGYNWQLPQIYKKSGIDYFVTQKMAWNDTTQHPHKLFWWESPDGSRLLTFFPHDYVNRIEPVRMARDLAAYTRQTGMPGLLHLYGVGDHGGGPTRHMLEAARQWQAPSAPFATLQLTPIQSFFDDVERRIAGGLTVPVWKSELYFQYHRGVQTTQAETKRNNRRNEALLLQTEKFATLARGGDLAYPQEELEAAWRKLLFNQFHDILPGSGIDVVYRDAARDQTEVRRFAQQAEAASLDAIAARIRTQGPGQPVAVFNSLSWPRSEMVEVEVRFRAPVRAVHVTTATGAPLLSEVLARDASANAVRIRFLATDVPALGYAVFRVIPGPAPAPLKSALTATVTTLENEFLRVRVDSKSGCITSLYDKRARRETVAPGGCANLLQTFRDKPRDWEAWNIDANFEDVKWDLDAADEVKLVESSPLRAAIRVKKHFQKSTFTQDITLAAVSPRLDVHMTADWREDQILLKVAFPVAAQSDVATFEMPYGAIERPTTRNTPEEKAQFEVPAHRWADLSDARGGVSLLNESKYGYDAKGNVLRLTLLRSPKWPDPAADRGEHHFTYSFYPHAGSWKEAGTVRRGYELNVPLVPVAAANHAGTLPPVHSFVSTAQENVVITAVKKAEDDSAWIVRFYEFAGRGGDVRLRFAVPPASANEVTLMEAPVSPLTVTGAEVVIPTRPYEIKTLKLESPAKSPVP
jgi:alpha-mannosidase